MKNLVLLLSVAVLIFSITIEASAHSRRKYKKTYKCSKVGIQKVKAHKGAELKSASKSESLLPVTAARHEHHRRFLEKQRRDSLKVIIKDKKKDKQEEVAELIYPQPVYFRFDSYRLDIVDVAQVVIATEWVKKGNDMLLIGHTDSMGSERYNQLLSVSRALHIKNLMVEMGCDAEKIKVMGEGEQKPQNTNDSEQNRLNNRRVEFVVLEK